MRETTWKHKATHNIADIIRDFYKPLIKKMTDDTKRVYAGDELRIYHIDDHKLARSVCSKVNVMIMDKIFRGFRFRMPYHMGLLEMTQYKRKIKLNSEGEISKSKNKIDFGASRKLWREMWPDKSWQEIFRMSDKPVLFHLNEHNPGWGYYLKWRRDSYGKNTKAFIFDRVRGGSEVVCGEERFYGNVGSYRVISDPDKRVEYPIVSLEDIKASIKAKK